MNAYQTDTNGAMTDNAPLFASVWLALFCELRKSFVERRWPAAEKTDKHPKPTTRKPH